MKKFLITAMCLGGELGNAAPVRSVRIGSENFKVTEDYADAPCRTYETTFVRPIWRMVRLDLGEVHSLAADIADTVELDANDPDVGTKAEAVRRQRRKIAIDVRTVCGDVEKARRRITDAINPDAFICSSESCRAWI